jgi:BirA family biotin operon repressor/biotin-[acetyl-CoA-carboxylase] ligase
VLRDDQLRDGDGRAALVDVYRARLVTLGRRVRVELHDDAVEGTARDVTDAGLLVVETGTGPRTIASGDVVHLRDAPGGSGGHG